MKIEIHVYHDGKVYARGVDEDDFPNRAHFYAALDALYKSVDLTMLRLFGVKK